MSEPRLHHYVFGHILLRQIFFRDASAFVAALREGGDPLLHRIWDDVGDWIVQNEEGQHQLPCVGLTCTHREIVSGTYAVIVSLPQPQEITEAHFVGLVVRPPKKRFSGLVCVDTGMARYITLERGETSDGAPRTVLCEWTEDSHVNMGDGPEATVDGFSNALAELVGKQRRVTALVGTEAYTVEARP
jgi:hypothetical protein